MRSLVRSVSSRRFRSSMSVIETHQRTGAFAVVPTFGGRRGHPVLWDQRAFPELESSPAATRDGARAVLRAHPAEIVPVTVDDPAIADAINTREDYERLVREINRDAY